MSGDIGRQSSREVAHEAEDTRANLASTLEQLRNNLKPENVMEEVVNNARIGASSVADNIFDVARQYPIPSALIAAGSAFVLRFFSKRGGSPDVTGFEPLEGAAVPLSASRRPSVKVSGERRSPLLRDPVAFDPAPGRAGGTSSSLGAGIAARGAALKRDIYDAYDSTTSQAGGAMQTVSRYIPHDRGEVRSKLSYLLEEQPLILGAIGLAVGAAIGAALPMTETEDSLMGGTAHRFRESAQDAARHEVEGLRTAAGEAIDNVRHSASDNLHGFVNNVGASAKTVVDKAGDAFISPTRDV